MALTKEEVQVYLREFKYKLNFNNLVFLGRSKNQVTIRELGISTFQVKEILNDIVAEDYSSGPVPEVYGVNGNVDMWVFGRLVKGFEIYIKISLGLPNENVICISFHFAEHPMVYPLKI